MPRDAKRARFVAYVRVSTSDQVENGVSLEAQHARLTAFAEALDLDLVTIHEDAGLSAKSLDRPGLLAALADLDAGRAEGLLVVKLDRLTRSVEDLCGLIRRYFAKRCELVSIGDSIDTRTANGRMSLKMFTLVAEWERESAGERTAAAMRHLKARGVRFGRSVPLGLVRTGERDQDGRLVVISDHTGAAIAAHIHSLRAGGSTLRAIAATLTAEGIPTRRGGKWAAGTVDRVLRTAVVAPSEPYQAAA